MSDMFRRMPATPASPDQSQDRHDAHLHGEHLHEAHLHDDAVPLRAGQLAPALAPGAPGMQQGRSRAQARGALSQAAVRVWDAMARDLRHAASSDVDDMEEGAAVQGATHGTARETGSDAAAAEAGHAATASPATMPNMLNAVRQQRAATLAATLQPGGRRNRDGDGGNAGIAVISGSSAAARGKRGHAVYDNRSVQQLSSLAPVDPVHAAQATGRRGPDKAAGGLQALRWGLGLAVAVLAGCAAWLLIDPHESSGEQGGKGGASQRCEGASPSCAK